MRVVAGRLGGRPLAAPHGAATRPTLDRVRAAVFDSLGARAVGAVVLDLYAGSGALGIEALSRGARRTVFVEQAGPALKCLRQNIAALGIGGECEVAAEPVSRALRRLRREGRRFDLVFADPPYDLAASEFMDGAAAVLAPDGILVAERSAREPEAIHDGLCAVRRAIYGSTAVTFWRTEVPLEEEADARRLPGNV